MKYRFISLISLLLALLTCCDRSDSPFKIDSKSVEEGEYLARALSPTQMISNYPMELDTSIPQPILFKLSLNGDDNEAGFGQDHYLIVPEGITEFYAPTLKFGVQSPMPPGTPSTIQQATNVYFRVDMRPVLESFEAQNYFITATNDTVTEKEFTGLYLAGGTAPLQWIWDYPQPPEHLRFQDLDQDSIYELTLSFEPADPKIVDRSWTLSQDISHLPIFSSPEAPLLEALTNLALEEAVLNIRDDGAFSAGKEWAGVWTRDLSFAGQLSLAYLFPENMKTSLRAKLSNSGRIIQDTGTGGSWPVSSDRHIWTIAAWEVFLTTGDEDWLNEIREPVIQALQEDLLWNRDPVSGMLQGETSFEDWREQTYPTWMTPSNIHSSHALSTNIIFKRALEIGLALSENHQDIVRSWPELIQRLDHNILRHFWSPDLNAPASYIMATPTWIPASHRDILGESLGILYLNSFTNLDSQLVASYPRTQFGTPIISHQLPHAPPYHNKAIWPFVETYGLLAAKQAENNQAYVHGFNSLIRSATLFMSHRENFEYNSGRPDETQINSDRQLWSVAGWLGAIYKGLFGITINYDFDRKSFDLLLEPNNPFEWDRFSLSNLTLHHTPITILINGSGSHILSMTINGNPHEVGNPIHLDGEALDIRIELEKVVTPSEPGIELADHLLPDAPDIFWSNDTLTWTSNSGQGIIELNGRYLDTLNQPTIMISDSLNGFFTTRSIDSTGQMSLPTKPHYLGPSATLMLSAKEPYYIEIGEENAFIDMDFEVPSEGNYLIRFVYSNGSGPINTGNTCGLAKLVINNWWLEQMISFPHTAGWDRLSTTSWAKAHFKQGKNSLMLNQETLPVTNMNVEQNLFRVFSVEIIPLQN
ncbi:MAG: hypothetical protein HN995_00935 [Candidatus Marinimicrobia bacterium]|nr:hypothetical protein [Candidatus Neomarinimicrobiota bacterium]MBT3576143.1 hypothetical protein [Candidatus Neomarinimicrobiota bacterium]MBT3678749.1 hypothetical protein [Candidatus Neomarinimicrobiota bacterium]MBT3951745.1 hypothetical protein [Candidatus Neomarinimicrobiota bacterium]MBT4251716.1 hypothetical protein [Candidatus Neomarinimicrobiota bacterium]